MTLRWTVSIAALAGLALACLVLGSSGPKAGEPAAIRLAGAAESEGGAGAAKDTDESEGASPQDDSGGKPAEPATDATGDQAAPGEETAGSKEGTQEEPDTSAEKAKTDEGSPEEDKEKAESKESEDKAESKEGTESQQASVDSSAAAEKVKSGEIDVPTDPVALAAFHALEKNCSRCHQAGPTLKRNKPAKNFGNILHLDELARDPNFILPGNPDGSHLFIQIAKKEMPYDCYQEFDCKAEPTEAEVKAVYSWIKSLGEIALAACAGRKVIDEEAMVTAIAADLDQQQEHRRKGMRYITLSNFYNHCVEETDMVRYRQGVVKLLNSLSRNSDVLKLHTIDPEKTIIAFNLDDLEWTEADWNRIIGTYPYAMKPDTTVYDTVASVTGTPLPWIRGDWFGFTASRPPLYYDLLKLPASFAELEKSTEVDVKSDIEKFLVKRAGFQNSGVSKHNRLIERHAIPTGYFWTSYDFKGDRPEQSLFIHPLGPVGLSDDAFKHDGGESIFSLPNGFQAYYLNTAKGDRLDKGPTEIVLDDSQLDRAVTDGISCFGCHNQGIRQGTDEIRKHVLGDRTFSKEVREQVEALYPTPEEFKAQLDEDATRFRNAMIRAGLDPELDSQKVGVESINYLAKAYEKSIDLKIAAAEYGLAAEAFAKGLSDAGGEAGQIKRRLEQGVLPREILEAEFKELIVKVSDNEPIDIAAAGEVAKVGGKSKEETHDFDLALTSDKNSYKVNDLPVFTIKSKEDCHLTLINVDASGEGTVIFPNKFQQDNLLPAGKEAQFPGSSAPFQFRLKDPGTETVIAICNASGKEADGIKHDFKKRQFTELGNYRDFLTRQIVVEGAEKIAEGKTGEKDKQPGAAVPGAPTSDILSRTAIKLEVK
jgi:Domain of unknown function (DUF4384)